MPHASTPIQSVGHVGVRHIGVDAGGGQGLQVLHRKEAAVGAYFLWHFPAAPLDRLHHGKQRSIVGGRLCHTLLDDQMILADGDIHRVSQSEASAVAQKTAVGVGPGNVSLPGSLQLLRGTKESPASRSWRRVISSFFSSNPDASLGSSALKGLLPAPNPATDSRPLGAQTLLRLHPVRRGVRRHAGRIDRYMPQASQPRRARQLHHLREQIVERPPVLPTKLVQASRNPASPRPPSSETPNPPAPAAPAAATRSPPAHKRTATPPPTAPARTPGRPSSS